MYTLAQLKHFRERHGIVKRITLRAGFCACGVWRVQGLLRLWLPGGRGVDAERGLHRVRFPDALMAHSSPTCALVSRSPAMGKAPRSRSLSLAEQFDNRLFSLQGRRAGGLLQRRLQHRAARAVGIVRRHALAAGLRCQEQQAPGWGLQCHLRSGSLVQRLQNPSAKLLELFDDASWLLSYVAENSKRQCVAYNAISCGRLQVLFGRPR